MTQSCLSMDLDGLQLNILRNTWVSERAGNFLLINSTDDHLSNLCKAKPNKKSFVELRLETKGLRFPVGIDFVICSL